ncbi:MAG: molecular chaperone TorD family protein [Rhodoplanes sp.]|uniref:molecular chaperone TorD family protein n=1 Tax=Rhodoplanes sp. TaxID=1968906 RepID=UPI0017F4962C|nr:molecular chaperone TorD family protein [Rhodoplanes sp.]NVO12423.1 molecular chaperone TorD family protein [Rhodoplanes sp.]
MMDPARNAILRSAIYGELARAFAYPGPDLFEDVSVGDLAGDLVDMITDVYPDEIGPLAVARSDLDVTVTDLAELEAQYLATFETALPATPLSLYEGSYVTERPRAELLLELDAFYRHFGLAPSAVQRDFADNLTAELEFMQFLAAKEAQALDQSLDAGPYLRAQRDFLDRHLAPMLAAMAGSADKVGSPLYRGLVRCAGRYVEADRVTVTERIPAAAA